MRVTLPERRGVKPLGETDDGSRKVELIERSPTKRGVYRYIKTESETVKLTESLSLTLL